jgi:uracil-DNA glycosylase family 4
MTVRELGRVASDVIGCRACPRLVEWRERVAEEKTARFSEQTYWGRPVPGFGDPEARVLILGLAPAAHGGNRTGRIFTGDRSGDFLFASLFRAGFANQPASVAAGDGLRLDRAYVSAVNRCAPPGNRPTPDERDRCLPYLEREMRALEELSVIVGLGSYAWDGALRVVSALGHPVRPRPRFAHAAEAVVGPYTLLGCFHPSQQNTFTGKLTPPMMDAIMRRAATQARVRPRVRPDARRLRPPASGAAASR